MTKNNRCFITEWTSGQKQMELLLYLDAHDHPIEIHPYDASSPSLIGNIYVARVDRVMPQIHAAFLKADDLTFFYPMEDTAMENIIFTGKNGKKDALVEGDELLVQVIRDAIKSKEICVSTNLSFSSAHLLLTTGNRLHGISKKISGERRKQIQSGFLDRVADENLGIVVRTNAMECDEDLLYAEYRMLQDSVSDLLSRAKHLVAGSLLSVPGQRHPFFEHIDRFQREGLTEIVTDDPVWYDRLKETDTEGIPVRLYADPAYSLKQLYGIEQMLTQALAQKVYLSSGGYLVIEPTEALTVIDVNSGKYTGKKKAEETYRKINLEAAAEIARQIRLRNLSGIILVDFINMENPDHQDELFHVLQKYLRKDPVKCKAIDITPLHILEMTRQKVRRPLIEDLRELSAK